MKNRRGGMITSFTVYRNGENEPKPQNNRRLIIEVCVLFAFLAAATVMLRFSYMRFMRAAYPLAYNDIVSSYARQYEFEPSLIYALIHTESGFEPRAVSKANAMGLMQLTKDTFEWAQIRSPEKEKLSADELFKPEVNIHYGVFVLSMLREEFDDTGTMLAAYNAGIGNVRGWLKKSDFSDDGRTLKYIPIEETRNYVKKIPKAKAIYQKLYEID